MLSIAILSTGLYLRSSSVINRSVERRLHYFAIHIRDLLEEDIERAKDDLITILANRSLEDYFMYLNIREMDYVEDARATLEENLLKIAIAKQQYATLRIFKLDGRGIINITDQRAAYKYPDPTRTDWFRAGLELPEGESYVSGVYRCHEHGLPSIFICHPYYERGRIRALAVLHFHIQKYWGERLIDIDFEKNAYAYLVDRHGVIIAHKYPDRVGLNAGDFHATRAVIAGQSGSLIEKDVSGVTTVKKSYLPLWNPDIGIVVAQPLNEAVAVSNSVKWYVIGMTSGVAVFLFLLIYFTSKKIVIDPIQKLSRVARQLMMGDLSARFRSEKMRGCWEIQQCDNRKCPAFGNRSRPCWYIQGTLCPTCIQGEYAEKIKACRKCRVYRKTRGDEVLYLAETFNQMAQSLTEHIDGLKASEKNLREQRQLLQTILDATPAIVGLQNRQFIFKAVNRMFCRFVDQSEDKIIGKTDIDLFVPDFAEVHRQESLRVMMTGKMISREMRITSPKGDKWFHVVRIPITDSDGDITGVLLSARDITEIKDMQARLLRAQKMESIGQLAAGVAHEINTPLGIILGYAQLLLEDVPENSPFHNDLEIIERQCRISRKIVADLLNFSRQNESSVAAEDIRESVDEVVDIVEHTFRLDNITIERVYADNLPDIQIDRERIKQVVMNLLNNARDAIGVDGKIRILVKADSAADEMVVSIIDNGCGIPASKQERIFDPFYTTKPVGKGTGLGLSVTFGIIQEHGGYIDVKSPVPRTDQIDEETQAPGTAFTIHLPLEGRGRGDREAANGENTGTG